MLNRTYFSQVSMFDLTIVKVYTLFYIHGSDIVSNAKIEYIRYLKEKLN